MNDEEVPDYVANPRGHVWKLDDKGEVDVWAWSDPYRDHNGPECALCGYSFCQHCLEMGEEPVPPCTKAEAHTQSRPE